MASKVKNVPNPRFDFGSNLDPENKKTGTLKELLAEINLECARASGAEVDLSGLGTVLAFIGQFTIREYTSITERLPLSVLKTVKLLYLKNDESGIQLFQYLKAPQMGASPTMEFRIDGVAPRNEYRVKLVNELLDTLSKEINSSRIHHIETSLLTNSKLLACIDLDNREILEPIYALHGSDDATIISLLGHLAQFIRSLPIKRKTSIVPLCEMVYTYLRILPFLHFVGEYKEILDISRFNDEVKAILPEIKAFCAKLDPTHLSDIQPDTPITSIDEFPAFFQVHARDFVKLVIAATKLPTQPRDFGEDKLGYASKLLHIYVYHQRGKTPLHARALSVSDCLAALCTMRLQRKLKTPYSAKWHGIGSDEIRTGLLGQMEKERDIEELYESDYIPHGISQLLYNRFCQFHARFVGQHDRHEASQAFQIARLEKYAECLLLSDAGLINEAVNKFDLHCEQEVQFVTHPAFHPAFVERMNLWLNRISG